MQSPLSSQSQPQRINEWRQIASRLVRGRRPRASVRHARLAWQACTPFHLPPDARKPCWPGELASQVAGAGECPERARPPPVPRRGRGGHLRADTDSQARYIHLELVAVAGGETITITRKAYAGVGADQIREVQGHSLRRRSRSAARRARRHLEQVQTRAHVGECLVGRHASGRAVERCVSVGV
eukprot:scaffold11375_cov123-Isochrysis_galbana.AAC.4